ncbi:MAG: segregation and condensation protein [Candidatus Taylorbacteria bacterium]|nr:segregation and condensation protein [Candidatus Taylorbacteria bacterium]
MNKEILDYIKTQRVGVLAVEMMDGSPHAATVHFAHTDDPLVFYFETYREYRKAEPLFAREKSRASFVIGSDESNMKTLQLDGIIELLKPEERGAFDSVYLGKFPEKSEKAKDPKFVFFKLTPTWWRFTDWTGPQGKKILIYQAH